MKGKKYRPLLHGKWIHLQQQLHSTNLFLILFFLLSFFLLISVYLWKKYISESIFIQRISEKIIRLNFFLLFFFFILFLFTWHSSLDASSSFGKIRRFSVLLNELVCLYVCVCVNACERARAYAHCRRHVKQLMPGKAFLFFVEAVIVIIVWLKATKFLRVPTNILLAFQIIGS